MGSYGDLTHYDVWENGLHIQSFIVDKVEKRHRSMKFKLCV